MENEKSSRKYRDGDYNVVKSLGWSAPGCHPTACGIKYYVDDDGKLAYVEGDEENPITKGALCVRCLTQKEYVYHPDRILYPMKRAKENRGKDAWERITWDEALDIIEENTKAVTEKYGSESILYLTGTGRQASQAALVMGWGCFDTPNVAYVLSGFSCYGPRVCVTNYALGAPYPEVDYAANFPDRYDNPEFVLPEYIVVWGKEPLKSNGDGFWGHSIVDMMKRGSKLIVVDPRLNWLSSRAEIWLQIRPGTDCALAMAMLNVIIKEDLYDHDFVEKWTFGFEDLVERVADSTPEWAAEICWIDAEDIYRAARAYANAKAASISWGVAVDQVTNSLQICHAILALMAITGNIDVPGGNTLGDPWHFGDLGAYPGEELMARQIGMDKYPAICRVLMFAHPDQTLECLETDEPYPIRMVWIQSTNPMANTTCVPERWEAGFARMDFVAASDVFMTPTIMASADLFLPIATMGESLGHVAAHYGGSGSYAGALVPAFQCGEAKSDMDIALTVGKRLHPERWGEFEDMEDYYNKVTLTEMGITYDEFAEKGLWQKDFQYRKYEKGILRGGEPGFQTPTGRIELYSTMFQAWGEDPLPYYFEPMMSPYSTPELAEKYPFVLTTGARTWSYFHSEGRQIPSLREIEPEPRCEINTEDAEALGIKDGDWVVLMNHVGKCKQKAIVTDGIKKGVIHAQHGWWFPEKKAEGPGFYDTYESNVNRLMPHAAHGKLGFGSPFKCLICGVRKATEDEQIIDPATGAYVTDDGWAPEAQ